MTDTPPDPFAFFRDALTQWEKSANEIGSRILGSEQMSEAMHKGQAASMHFQHAISEAMARALSAANMPSKADIEALGVRLNEIESRLIRIESTSTGRTEKVEPAMAWPKRTRKPANASKAE